MRRYARIMTLTILMMALSATVQAATINERFNMSYIYFGSTETYIKSIDNTGESLNHVSPTYLDIGIDGRLVISDKFDANFIETMQERDIKVVPFLSNHWDREAGRTALKNREALADQIVTVIEDYNLDGVNIDIENLTEVDRENYVDFIRILRDKLPSAKELSVAVAANPTGKNDGWQGSYDYKQLARYADYLVIMAYDETSEGDRQGPVASVSFVEKSIQYAIERVVPEKIVLGVPFYGRYWKSGQSYGGYGIHLTKIHEMLGSYNSSVVFDDYLGVPKATVTIRPQDSPMDLFGKKLGPGVYTIWFENELSIQYKLRLVQKYNLKGTASWSLGQETPETWDYYQQWLNGNWFVDTKGHWAQQQISDMESKGWMKGISSTHFAPDRALTRAQAAAILSRVLNLSPGKSTDAFFKDVNSSHWAYEDIKAVWSNGIMQGTGKGRFAPDDPLTREQMAVMLDRVFGTDVEDGSQNPYRDIAPSRWSYQSIVKMSDSGIFTGYEDGTFRPAEIITRAQMATIMDRLSVDFIE